MISAATIERLRAATDLRALVEETVQLNRQGVGVCPFHVERTASFRVYEDGHFYCFGCALSGDAFTFLMKTESLTFTEACQRLSERTGISLDEAKSRDPAAERRAEALVDYRTKRALWYWREQRIIATKKRSDTMLDWIDRLTGKELAAIWMAEWTPALESIYQEDLKVTQALGEIVRDHPEALNLIDRVVSRYFDEDRKAPRNG